MTGKYYSWIEKEISRHGFGKEPQSLYDPIHYIMSLGGKRLRPLLVLMAYSLYRNDVKKVVTYAMAVEAFHNFTLMHDDIMDKAPLRRGKKTVHKKWNINTAILSGDVMLVKVYEIFATLPDKQLKKVLTAFNRCAAEVCEGQQWDMEFESTSVVTEAHYIEMIRLKTAVLLGFSLELGGILAGASAAECSALRSFGINMGIGFQLKDDLLDAYGDPKKFGKQVGGDIISNKKTYLAIQANSLAKGTYRKELDRWSKVKRFNKQEKVKAVISIYNHLNIPGFTEKKIDSYFNKAFRQLKKIKASSVHKEVLEKFTRDLINRQH